jgi:hypothetical protein
MPQQHSPWLEGAYGWNFGEGGWNSGMDQNLLKFSFMIDHNVDGIVSSLPAASNGQAYFLTTDNRLYFAVGTTWFSGPTPKWFEFKDRSTGNTYQFNGSSVVLINSPSQIDNRLDAVELTVAGLGTAAFEDIGFFATQPALDIVEASAQAYTDDLAQDLADGTDELKGAALVGYKGGTVADSIPVYGWQFGVLSNGGDDTAALQAAIDYASTNKRELRLRGIMTAVPANAMTDEAGSNLAALLLRSNLRIVAEPLATIKIADGVSSDLLPVRHSMFFSNEFLENIEIVGLTMDMNGANNPISPNRGSLVYNKFTNAQFIFSGTPGGVAAGANNVLLEKCRFINNAGVSCIVMAQSNTPGVTLGKGWKLLNNTFYNVGQDTDDHSCVFGWANDVLVQGNTFDNPAMWDSVTHCGGLVAYEVHGSDTRFIDNRINNFYQGVWLSINMTDTVRRVAVANNTARVACCFSDFYSANLGTGPSPELDIQGVSVHDNEIDITADTVPDTVKTFFRIAARRQPTMVDIHDNVCRSFETTKNTTLSLLATLPDQLALADSISIHDNIAAGINAGLVVFFGNSGALQDVAEISFENNKLGTLVASPGGLYPVKDVYLYGAFAGRVRVLRLGGLQTPVSPVGTDDAIGGRATVYGKALLDLPVAWSGVTIGDGVLSKKIALDTDVGVLHAEVSFTAGPGSSFIGSISPTIGGISADAIGTAATTHFKTGESLSLPGLVFTGGGTVSLYNSVGTPFDGSQLNSSSYLAVSAKIPCRSANI